MKLARLLVLAAPLLFAHPARADVAPPPPDLAGSDGATPSPTPVAPPKTTTASGGCDLGGHGANPFAALVAVAAAALLTRRRAA